MIDLNQASDFAVRVATESSFDRNGSNGAARSRRDRAARLKATSAFVGADRRAWASSDSVEAARSSRALVEALSSSRSEASCAFAATAAATSETRAGSTATAAFNARATSP